MTDELAAFVLERLREDEADARAAIPPDRDGRWSVLTDGGHPAFGDLPALVPMETGIDTGHAGSIIVGSVFLRWARPLGHIARQDPASTLARVAALRALVAHHAPDEAFEIQCRTCYVALPCETLTIVASMWRDHPDHPERRRQAGGS